MFAVVRTIFVTLIAILVAIPVLAQDKATF